MNAIAERPEVAGARAGRAPRAADPFDPGPPSPLEPARRREEAETRRERSPRLNLDFSSRHHLIAWAMGEADPAGFQYPTSLLEIDRGRRDLAGASPSPAEEHLAETAALCWYALRAYEIKHSQRMNWPKGYAPAEADFYQKSIERTQRRFEMALKSLALLRRIELPSLRVSVGQRPVGIVRQEPTSSPAMGGATQGRNTLTAAG